MQEANAMRDELLREFVESYMEKLFYFCLKKTGSREDAEDLTQEIALQIITAINRGTLPTSFSAWVWQIARNRYSAWAKGKHSRNESVTGSDIGDLEIEDESEPVLDGLIRAEQMSLLRRELAFVGSEYRNIVVAHYLENKSVREIATSLALPESTVKSRLFRARKILKEGMDMAREFGVRSYRPEKISYSVSCNNPGAHGQPWVLMEPSLHQNIFLSCYGNPMTAQELAIEVGVALPYMEDAVRHLTEQTLLCCQDGKYETDFPIISREAQERIQFYYEGILPGFVEALTEDIDRLMEQFRDAGLCYYGEFLDYETAKWTLLLLCFYDLYTLCPDSPKLLFGSTKRRMKGVWDVLGQEQIDSSPACVGHHGSPNGFMQYRFTCFDLYQKSPEYLSQSETAVLKQMVQGEEIESREVADRLVEYGYATRDGEGYRPRIVVIDQSVNQAFLAFCEKKQFGEQFSGNANVRNRLHAELMHLLAEINKTVRQILCADLPQRLKADPARVDALLGTVCEAHMRKHLVEQALACGWLKYDEAYAPALGAYITLS